MGALRRVADVMASGGLSLVRRRPAAIPPPVVEDDPTDRLYLHLKGARERLCLAQHLVPRHWSSDLQAALNHIDECGSALCPQQWSRFDQPEYGECPT